MQSFRTSDLRERSGDLVSEMQAGRMAVVTKYGKPSWMGIPLTEGCLGLWVYKR